MAVIRKRKTILLLAPWQIDYSRDSNVIEYFACEERVEERYRFALLQPALRPLGLSTKTSLRVNEDGQLSLQFMVPAGGHVSFVEYLVGGSERFS